MLVVILVLSFLFVVYGDVYGVTRYIGTSGSDANSCSTATSSSAANRKRSINSCISCMNSGDVCVVGNGSYAEKLNQMPSGSSGSLTTLVAENVGQVTITPPSLPPDLSTGLVTQESNYTRIEGIKVDGNFGWTAGVTVGGNNNILCNVEVTRMSGQAVLGSPTNMQFLNVHVHHTGEYCHTLGGGDPYCPFVGYHHAFYLYIDSGPGNIIDNNHVHDLLDGHGYQLYAGGVVVQNTTVENLAVGVGIWFLANPGFVYNNTSQSTAGNYSTLSAPVQVASCTGAPSPPSWNEPSIDGSLRNGPLEPPPVTGSTFYVDKNSLGGTCNDSNAGTQSSPWCTIGKAAATLTAGQQGIVRDGTYTEGNIKPANSGSAGNYITLREMAGETVILDCSGFNYCWHGHDTGSRSYWVFDGFEMKNASREIAICYENFGCHHLWIINGKIHDTTALFSGVFLASSRNVVSNNEIYNIGKQGIVTDTSSGNSPTDNIFEFNIVRDSGRDGDDDGGIKCFSDNNCVVRYNTVYNVYRNPASSVDCFAEPTCRGVSGIYLDLSGATGGTMSFVYNNVVHDNDTGINIAGTSRVKVFNNLVYHNGFTAGDGIFEEPHGNGIHVYDPATSVEVYSNTSYGNKRHGLRFHDIPSSGAVVSRNNIVTASGGTEVLAVFDGGLGNADFNYDLIYDSSGDMISWNGTGYASIAAFQARGGNTTWLNAVGSAPSFVNAATGNFHLVTGSAGLNQGTSVASSFDLDNETRTTNFDIGAYEGADAGPVVTSLAFEQQPSNGIVNQVISPAVSVRCKDQFGANITCGFVIVMNIYAHPSGGELIGSLQVQAVNGLASFSDLRVNQIGQGFVISADDVGATLIGADSNAFNMEALTSISSVRTIHSGNIR